jgi:hypothetical protein
VLSAQSGQGVQNALRALSKNIDTAQAETKETV